LLRAVAAGRQQSPLTLQENLSSTRHPSSTADGSAPENLALDRGVASTSKFFRDLAWLARDLQNPLDHPEQRVRTEENMVIEKFLAISMIALGLAAQQSSTLASIAQDIRSGGRNTRRRVRWLRQNMGRRPGGRGNRQTSADLRDPDSVR
jgi:hypothetical protein